MAPLLPSPLEGAPPNLADLGVCVGGEYVPCHPVPPTLNIPLLTRLASPQAEGSVLRDLFKSLQKRSLIEPWERAKWGVGWGGVILTTPQIRGRLGGQFLIRFLISFARFKRRYCLKYVEKRAFWEVT